MFSGMVLAAVAVAVARFGSARAERAWFGSLLAFAALIYVVVAVPHLPSIALAGAGAVAFLALAWFGYRGAVSLLALGWGLHAVWDGALLFAGVQLVPPWYYIACIAFDFAVAFYLLLIAFGLLRGRRASTA